MKRVANSSNNEGGNNSTGKGNGKQQIPLNTVSEQQKASKSSVGILASLVGSGSSVSSAGTGKGHSSSNYRQTSSKKSTTSISRTQGSSKSSGATSRRSQGSSGFFLSVVSVSFILIFPRSPVI